MSAAARTVAQLRAGDRVVVIGAGPAGLTAAYLLAKQRLYDVTVLEADTVVGGIARTARYKEFRFDIGGHRFFTKIQAVENLWHELIGSEFISVPRLSRIHYNGRFFDYPLRARNALRGVGVINAARIVLSYLKWNYRPYPVEDTFEQWVTNRFGKRLYEMFFRTYTEKVWGIPCAEIRAEWAAQRIHGLSLPRAILNATVLNRRAPTIKTLIHEFKYPRLGPGQMWEACHDRIVAFGQRVLVGTRVTGIALSRGRACCVHTTSAAGAALFEADHVITTMALQDLVSALSPSPPTAVLQAAAGLRYRAFLIVALMLDQDRLFPDNWIYVHTPGVQVGRIQNFNNWSAAMVPVSGMTCLGMEYFCFEGDALWTTGDEELIAQARRELETLGLAGGARVVDGTVIRVPKAYPIYDSQYRTHLEAVREYIDPIPNLHSVGRNGMHKYNNQDHSMLSAMLTLANMQGGSHDPWDVNTELDYHETQTIVPEPATARR